MRSLLHIAALLGVLCQLRATTLEQLPLPEMARQSTVIVRAKVVGASAILRGADVYTLYRLQIAESWKRPAGRTISEVAVPGGVAGGIRQMVAGAPQLQPGGDYLLFLWTGRSGITQIIGLSQGVFGVGRDSKGEWIASRGAANETMLDSSFRPVRDEAVSMKLSELRTRVDRALLRTPQEAK